MSLSDENWNILWFFKINWIFKLIQSTLYESAVSINAKIELLKFWIFDYNLIKNLPRKNVNLAEKYRNLWNYQCRIDIPA